MSLESTIRGVLTNKHAPKKEVQEAFLKEQNEDDMPASPDEKGMAMAQLNFIKYAAEEIGEYIEKGAGFPEWFQNKLTRFHEMAKDMHAYMEGENSDENEEEMNEAKKVSTMQIHKVLAPTKNSREGIAALKKAFRVNDNEAKKMLDQAMNEEVLYEKAMSQAQQKAAGAALAAKRGEIKPSELVGASKEMYDSMTTKELEDFASTKHKGLPKKVEEEAELDEVLDTPKAMDSYRNKANYSKDRAANSAAAKMLRKRDGFHSTDTSDELHTMDKRAKGLKMVDRAAARKTRAMIMKKEEAKPDAVEVMRKKQQMDRISKSDKDKLSKVADMMRKEREAQAKKMSNESTFTARFKEELREKKRAMKETKAAPKGYHFTKDGKLKKGDADVDGPGGEKLRADPLDKQRSKIPPLPEQGINQPAPRPRPSFPGTKKPKPFGF